MLIPVPHQLGAEWHVQRTRLFGPYVLRTLLFAGHGGGAGHLLRPDPTHLHSVCCTFVFALPLIHSIPSPCVMTTPEDRRKTFDILKHGQAATASSPKMRTTNSSRQEEGLGGPVVGNEPTSVSVLDSHHEDNASDENQHFQGQLRPRKLMSALTLILFVHLVLVLRSCYH